MMEIKLLVLMSTLIVGFFYTRKEIGALISIIAEKDYVSWREFNEMVEKRGNTVI